MRYYPPRESTLVTQCEQCRLCLVKDMKTLCMSVNYAAGMSAEPPQCVEQLMVRLAWLCVSSGCLAGVEGALLVSVPKADWPSCCLLGLWWAAESLRRDHWGFQAACLQRGVPYLCHPLSSYISHVYIAPYEVILTSTQGWYRHLIDYLLIWHGSLRKCYMQSIPVDCRPCFCNDNMKFMAVGQKVSTAASQVKSTVCQMSLYNIERAMYKHASATPDPPIYRCFLCISMDGTMIKTKNLNLPARDNSHRWD